MKFYALLRCGCCTEEMEFKSEESIQNAFNKVGVAGTDVVDDDGVTHENIDMFYGFWTEEDEKNGLEDA